MYIPGDANGDGDVGFADYLIVSMNFGKETGDGILDGDFDENGVTDFADYLTVARNYGTTNSSPDQPTTPHPQAASIADRVVTSEGNDAFKTATAMTAVSPALSSATPTDLVLTYDELLAPAEITVVVLKPRANESVYSIPSPAPTANIFDFLKDHLTAAARAGVGLIEFPPDHEFEIVPPTSTSRHLKLADLQDVTIDLNGSTLQLTQPTWGIEIGTSQRVTLKNGTIRGHGVLATIGRVMRDTTAAGLRFEVLPEYRELLEADTGGQPQLYSVGNVERAEDGSWQLKSTGYSELFSNTGSSTNNFAYDDGSFIATSPLGETTFQEGEYVWLKHQQNSGHAIVPRSVSGIGVSDLTLEDLTFVNIPGMVLAGDVLRGLHINNIRIAKATPQAFLAASSDGIHVNGNGGDIVIENSQFGPNGDDKININGSYWTVTEIDRSTNSVSVRPVERATFVNRWGSPDDRIVVVGSDYSVLGEAEVAEISVRHSERHHTIRLRSIPPQLEVNSIIGNVDKAGARVVIRGNTFTDTRAQGIIVQTSHVVVEDNSFAGIAGPPLKLNLDLDAWYEGINTNNVLIRNNTFERSAFDTRKSSDLIYFHQFDSADNPVEIIDNVRIVGNTIAIQPDTTQTSAAVARPEEPHDSLNAHVSDAHNFELGLLTTSFSSALAVWE